ncbi:MAG: cytochrome c [Nitrospirae bacterium]|nr:cytochrome c [Nitrospirota bacterium]
MRKIFWLLVVVIVIVFAGSAFAADGKSIFTNICAACHGQKGEGSPIAPALKGNAFVKDSDIAAIKQVILKGRSGKDRKHPNFPADMPAQALSDGDAEAVANYEKNDLQK